MPNAKQEILALLDRLPDECTLEEIQYHVHILAKVRRSEASAANKGTLAHDEVERRVQTYQP
ncbi:hypothetical protein [Massilia sp. YIM B04103]|uniref:hypothetical protein n=1 Tax=Massilia sp. YIM B04103 TaxID=2963106 RepID=UPI00210CC8A0|nr:hypothetical protein [Massilia sp. YIM B04103]